MSLIEFLEKYWMVLLNGVIFPTFWYALGKTFAHKSELDVEKNRITKLEGAVKALPSSSEINDLNRSMSAIGADMVWLKKNVDLLVQKELNKTKKD